MAHGPILTIPKNILTILIQNQDGQDKSKDIQDDAAVILAIITSILAILIHHQLPG